METAPLVKENRSWEERGPLSAWWVWGALAASMVALVGVARLDEALPAPRPPPPRSHPATFSGELAHQHLVNLTSIGPRVAGSYENEVLAVNVIVSAVKQIAASSSPHNLVEVDLHRASGAFQLSFFDGMNNIYRSVQSVVVRVRGAGGSAGGPRRSALLLNCHIDTVPDSPGASDDGAGCAVLLETLRALASTPHPLRHDAIFLFNGAEENIMQASHAFITTHKWARWVRAFINVEACGAGGREVLFQAGPHDPWIMEVYAEAVPYPFASSLAQELFESGLIPADTDFRIFRDFGNLSGVDLAWNSNGYVYHTHLDTARSVPASALQRTGDNVLALAHGVVASSELSRVVEPWSRQPVFFDVLGLYVLCARAPLAAAIAAATLAVALYSVHLDARLATKQLYVRGGAWWYAVGEACAALCGAWLAGLGAAAGVAVLVRSAGAALSFYARPALLAPLYGAPAVGVAWVVVGQWASRARVGGVPARGWVATRLACGAVLAGWAALLLVLAAGRLRSGFVPLQWVLPLAVGGAGAGLARAGGAARLVVWTLCAVLPVLQACYLAVGVLQMFVPIMGRAGTPPLPPDVVMAVMTGALSLSVTSWLVPVVAAARGAARAGLLLVCAGAVCALLVCLSPLGAPYSPERPQRFMVFHTRRSTRAPDGTLHNEDLYWAPHLDDNTYQSLQKYVPEAGVSVWPEAECVRWPYCGAPYFVPVLGLISRGYSLPAPAAPALRLRLETSTETLSSNEQALHLYIQGGTHVVLVVSAVEGARVTWCSALDGPPREGARWGLRRTYFLTLHDARALTDQTGAGWNITLHLRHESDNIPPAPWWTLSAAAHGMTVPRSQEHQRLFDSFPAHAAPTGWPVHMHLLTV